MPLRIDFSHKNRWGYAVACHRWGGVERPGRDPLTVAHMSRWVLSCDLRTVSKTSLTPELTLHIYLCSIRATAASTAAAGASGPRAVPQTAVQLGARRGRLLSRPLLHPTDTGAAQRRLAHSFFCYKPQLYLLGCEQVSSFAIYQPPQSHKQQYQRLYPETGLQWPSQSWFHSPLLRSHMCPLQGLWGPYNKGSMEGVLLNA